MKIKSKKKMKKTGEEATLSAQTVASLDDLLIEILLRLPMKSLICFKSVSKQWLSLITDPQFALRRNPSPNPAVGLFHVLPSTNCYDYNPFDIHNPTTPPFRNLIKSTEHQSGFQILHSCNGFLLCGSPATQESEGNYCLYNPTTKQLTRFPKPRRRRGHREVFRGLTLAFDPAKSPHYKIVCVRDLGIRPTNKYQIEIYSSATGTWRVSGEPFTEDLDTRFEKGVYWNSRVHWLCGLGKNTSLCFNVDEERLGLMPMPPFPDEWLLEYNTNYFDESCDHLYMIDIYGPQIEFDVYELKRDYSEWFVKYHVDLSEVAAAFPGILRQSIPDVNRYSFSIFSLIRGQKEEDAFLVLRIPGKAIRYNLVSKPFDKLCDFEGGDEEDYPGFSDPKVFPHIETLCCV